MASLGKQLRNLLTLLSACLLLASCGGGSNNASPAGADASLASLTLSAGTLSPVFSSAHSSYFITVDASVSSLLVTAVTTQNAATMTVNGVATPSGTASSPVNLAFGVNSVDVVVTAEDGVTTGTYRLTVERGTTDANLSGLTLNAGALSPAFSASQTSYAVAVNWAVTTLQVTATAASDLATLTVDGTSTPSGVGSAPIALAVGVNTVDIVVTAGDGATAKTYSLTITRDAVDVSLSALVLSSGALSPTFSPTQSSYTATVSSAVTSLQVTATVANSASTLTINGVPTASGAASAAIGLAVGTNHISIVVTASDGITTQTYNVVVTRPSNDATLTALTLSTGTLSPAFFSGQTAYTATVGAAVTTIQVTAAATSGAATMTVNGIATSSGAAASVSLAVGDNSIGIVVTAQDGVTTKTYNIVVTRPSADATLTALTLSSGTLSPVFSSSTTNYSSTVGSGVASVQVTATLTSSVAGMTINGAPTASGSASSVSLAVGDNPVSIVVTAQDGVTTKTYNLTITRPSTDATLSALALSSTTLSPAFSSAQTAYSALVGAATASVQVTATTTDGAATVTVNGLAIASGTPSAPVSLAFGVNHISVVVTAQDGITTQTYDITVGRGDPDASLSALSPSSGALSPAFSSVQTSYSVTVPSTTSALQLTPTSTSGTATLTVNGVATASGAAATIALVMGNNPVAIVVTAQDGITTQTYDVNVIRGSTDATLSALALSSGTLSPAFSPGQTAYSVAVPSGTSSIQVTATTTSNAATMTVNGVPTLSGSASAAIPLTLGANNVDVVVTAQDGVTTKTYTITAIRGSIDATLSALSLSSGSLSPAFASAQTGYSASVASGIASIQVTATTSSGAATMTVNGAPATSGAASSAIPLSLGTNNISIVVTAEDGTTTKTYSVTVTRGSIDASLSALTLSSGTLGPVFSPSQTSYSATLGSGASSIQVTPTTASSAATMTVNGAPTTSGAAASISLVTGDNPISIVVTAEDGVTTRTYAITVTVPGNVATLSALTLSSGTLSPTFSSGTIAYAATVDPALSSIQVTPTATSSVATMTVNGTPAMSGTASTIGLSVGDNAIAIVVTAQDGVTTQTYNLTVTRPSTDATLSNLVLSSGTLSPTFSATQTSYSASVASGVGSIQVTATTTSNAATMKVNGVSTASGAASAAISLNVGTNLITVDITAQDGATTKSYTISISRPSADATLTALTLSAGTLTFDSLTTVYATQVSSSLASITVTATANSGAATMTVNGAPTPSGTATSINLVTGDNPISIVVTAQDGVTTKTYTVTVVRPSTDATLSGLTVSTGALSPAFASTQTIYSMQLSAVASIQVTATTNSSSATMTVNGTPTTSGSASTITLNTGMKTVTIAVTAQDGVTTKTYSITIVRTDATLSALSISAGTLDQIFQSTQASYTASVPYLRPSTTVTATTTNAGATLKVNTVATTSGSPSAGIDLTQGSNTISVVVTAPDGTTTQTYSIAVTRLALNANVVTFAGTSGTPGTADGTGTAASFNNPTGITTDGTNLYISDTDNHTIRKIVIATGAVTTIAGTAGVQAYTDDTGTLAQFRFPTGITTDGTNLFIADSGNNVIRHIALATSVVTTFAGTGAAGSVDGAQSIAQFNDPSGITTTGSDLYVADTLNNTIRKIAVSGSAVTTFAGTAGAAGTADGVTTAARFRNPYGITNDGVSLYVSDTLNNSIRRIDIATGDVTTLAGSVTGISGYVDATGVNARFNQPVGITTDGENLYVSDQQNHRIRKIVIATGVVTTLAGSGAPGGLDGTGTTSKFNLPDGINNDGNKLYVTDFNHVIRQID
ncbi:MAG: hypothetical protein GC138_01340 [Gammaproteobacteria bacterium]|nr:hypothetical protein [Gammaproteobacteria bacterium]